MAKTTVVIPNYNGIKYLEDCLTSLFRGTVIPHVIVVDNGSADGSRELAEEKFPDVKLIAFEDNTGFCKAVNAGIRASDTEYVMLLNNDTVADKEMIEQLEKALDGECRAFSVAAKMINLYEPDKLDDAGDFYSALGWAYARGKDKPAECYNQPGTIFSACAGAALYRREVFEEIGYFDEQHFAYLEDIDMGYRAKIYGYTNYFIPSARVYHMGSATTGSRYNELKVRLSARNSIYVAYKNMPLGQLILNSPLLLAGILAKYLFFSRKHLGREYRTGISQGIALCKKGNKVKYQTGHLRNYIKIQLELWKNIGIRFIKI